MGDRRKPQRRERPAILIQQQFNITVDLSSRRGFLAKTGAAILGVLAVYRELRPSPQPGDVAVTPPTGTLHTATSRPALHATATVPDQLHVTEHLHVELRGTE
jgi:hypothetical protein